MQCGRVGEGRRPDHSRKFGSIRGPCPRPPSETPALRRGRGCCCPTKLRELEQTVQGLPYIAKCAVGDKTAPPNNHLLRVNIDLSTFYKTCTIICDNQNPSPRALQDLEMSKYSVSSPCGAPKSRDTYRSVLQSISAGLTTKRIFQ